MHCVSRCHKRAVRAVVQGMVSPRGAMYLTIQVSVFYALMAVRAFCELAGLKRWHAALRSASSRPKFEAEEELLVFWGEVLGVSNGFRLLRQNLFTEINHTEMNLLFQWK